MVHLADRKEGRKEDARVGCNHIRVPLPGEGEFPNLCP